MEWPQITIIVLYTMSLTLSGVKHGESQDAHNFWHTLIGSVIIVTLLWFGGFWG